jgi:hypothetical protein
MSGQNSSGGIGVVGLLGVVFVALKLSGKIDWSWWWVLLPFYGLPVILGVVCFLIFSTVYVKSWHTVRAYRKPSGYPDDE